MAIASVSHWTAVLVMLVYVIAKAFEGLSRLREPSQPLKIVGDHACEEVSDASQRTYRFWGTVKSFLK
jgi:hypothetical protein